MPPGVLRIRRALLFTRARAELPLLRLPTALFPTQCCSLRLTPDAMEDAAIAAPKHLVERSWREFGGRLAAFCGTSGTGVELNLVPLIEPDRSEACVRSGSTMWKRVRESDVPTPPGVVHAVGGSRLRLVRSSLPHSTVEARPGDSWQLATVDVLDDEPISEGRRERLRQEWRKLRGGPQPRAPEGRRPPSATFFSFCIFFQGPSRKRLEKQSAQLFSKKKFSKATRANIF